MVSKILARLSYANVAATLALFFALGGTAYAAATIGSADIVNNSVRSADIHNHTLKSKDIASGVLTPKLYREFQRFDGSPRQGKRHHLGDEGRRERLLHHSVQAQRLELRLAGVDLQHEQHQPSEH